MLVSSIVLEKEGAFGQNHVPTMRNEKNYLLINGFQ
ncbi:hypothetical protein IKQ_02687 [Bacillus cereus VDM053]|nr:hypothetical protein IKQ_02687 [Bacillus cereus VDM053]SEB18973.1 hypothetical protein SAMN04488146_11529 [Bacillus nitratireducens]